MIKTFKQILLRCWNLIVSTSNTWDDIAKEYPSEHDMRKKHIYPLTFLCVGFVFICDLIYASDHRLQIGFLQAIITAVALLGGYFSSCYGCYWYLNRRYPNQYLKEDCTKVVSYCYTVIFALKIITTLIPSLFFLQILSVFTGYLVWEACRAVFNISEDERSGVVLVFTLIIIFVTPICTKLMHLMLPNAAL